MRWLVAITLEHKLPHDKDLDKAALDPFTVAV